MGHMTVSPLGSLLVELDGQTPGWTLCGEILRGWVDERATQGGSAGCTGWRHPVGVSPYSVT